MIIQQNKRQTLIYAIVITLAAVGLLFPVFYDMRELPHEPSFILDNVVPFWIFRALCVVLSVFCALGAAYLYKQLSSKEPLIEICDEYFCDNSSAISLGKIAWSDMKRAYFKGVWLNIELFDSAPYLERKNWISKILIKSNKLLGYADVCISTQRFNKQNDTFFVEFNKRKMIEKS